jgi:hypothetical protein
LAPQPLNNANNNMAQALKKLLRKLGSERNMAPSIKK